MAVTPVAAHSDAARRPTSSAGAMRAPLLWLNLAVFVISALAIAVSVNVFAHRGSLRWQFDATKTRAYSLSDQTRQLLESLEGDWRISIVLVEREVDRGIKRQIDEVLARCDTASPRLSVERIDPTRPQAVRAYEALLQRLRRIYAGEVDRYETLVERAHTAHGRAAAFALDEAQRLRASLDTLSAGDPIRGQLEQIRNGFSLLGASGEQIREVVDESLATSETKPIPEYERARDTLAAALSSAAQDLAGVARYFERVLGTVELEPALRNQFAIARKRYDDMAVEAQAAADPLIHLPPLELSRIGKELSLGEAAVITSDSRAAVIPASQILPRANFRATPDGGVTFDQRFRGEQVLASTIRSLLMPHMPLVVFVHAEEGSMLRPRRDRADVAGCASVLSAARYDVQEWGVSAGDRPRPRDGQAAVWVVLPRPFNERFKSGDPTPGREERALIEAARSLIESGENVLLSYYPSVLHKLRQPDPWQGLLVAFGWEADTSRVVMESALDASGESLTLRTIDLTELALDHPVSRATSGQRFALPLAVPIVPVAEERVSVRSAVLADVAPDTSRWAETNWVDAIARPDYAPSGDAFFDHPLPLAVALARANPGSEGREQRVIAVGSGAWMQSDIADYTDALGGGRVALVNPGNFEFLQASIAWLSNEEELIAQSPTSQQVQRLDGVADSVRNRWRAIALVVMPGGCLLLGVLVWFMRRR